MKTHWPIYKMVESMSKQRTIWDDLSVWRVLAFEELLPKIQELEQFPKDMTKVKYAYGSLYQCDNCWHTSEWENFMFYCTQCWLKINKE